MEEQVRQTHGEEGHKSQKRGLFARRGRKNNPKHQSTHTKANLPWIAVNSNGMILLNPPKFLKSFALFCNKHKLATKIISIFMLIVIVSTIFINAFESYFKHLQYQLSPKAEALLMTSTIDYGTSLKYDFDKKVYNYNQDYKPTAGEVAGQVAGPKFSAVFNENPKDGIEISDPQYEIGFKLKPKYNLMSPKQEKNRLLYAMPGKDAVKVISLGVSGMKEDIILENFQDDVMEFEYEIVLPDSLEAKLENNGSIAIYGPANQALLGSVATGSDADAQLLEKARKKDKKTTLIFTLPAPYIKESGKKVPNHNAKFELDGNKLTIKAFDLRNASYPLTIDPSVYIETAAKLMRGNNETNVDFDVDNELIQKSQTTGARIDEWTGTTDLDSAVWDQSTAAAGGYVYKAGGRDGLSKPNIASEQTTTENVDDTSFVMNMPSTRPAGDLYLMVMCHDGTATMTAPAGWTEYADVREFAAYYKIGTDAGGGNEASTYTWTVSASETKAGSIMRITDFNTLDPISGLYTTGSSASDTTPVFPAMTPEDSTSLVIRAEGNDADTPSATAWIPSGHTKIASSASGGGGGNPCGFVAASLDASPAAGVSTGTATLADASILDTYGAMSIAINPATSIDPPVIASQQTSTQGTNSTSFAMTMPSTRPAGDLYVAIMCHDGSGTNIVDSSGTWTEYYDTREHAAYYKIGTNVSGGNEAASYTFTGASEAWGGVIMRITGFDSGDIQAGAAGSGSNGGNVTPVFPTQTPDENSTLIIRAQGNDDDVPSATAWLPPNHTKIDSGESGGGAGTRCGYTSASMIAAPASGVATGADTLADASINDTYGASTLAIKPSAASAFTETIRATVDWAKFNPTTGAIDSPNPGTGACAGWCTNSVYDLPEGRVGMPMVSYNGFLYAIGGSDGTNRESTVWISKLGANGEPSLWHPTGGTKVYWYPSSNTLTAATSYSAAAVYNNRLYLLGGQTNASAGGVTTVAYTDLKPTGDISAWSSTGMQALPDVRHGHSVHIYNDVMYLIGGNSNGTLRNTVYYSKLNTDGTMNAWTATTNFTTARSSFGGLMSGIWGAYIYVAGGCTALTSGYCSTVASDIQLASINADGSIAEWGSINNIANQRIGYSFIAWQNGLYRFGGCSSQNTTTGVCLNTFYDVDYGVINQDGDASTVATSVASGVAPCTGGSPVSCNLPGTATVGNILNASAILNGYLYIMGGCTANDCSTVSRGVVYQAIASDGSLAKPSSCGAWGTSASYCTNSTSLPNALGAAGTAIFNGRIYIVGGFPSITNITYAAPNTDGSITTWTSTDLTTAGALDVSYSFAYARANPAAVSTAPGNLYIFGGCTSSGTVTCTTMTQNVYKCAILTSGAIDTATNPCTTTGQLAIGTVPGASGTGLGAHAGAVYANYIYLIGGLAPGISDLTTVRYAKFDNSNNVVTVGSGWVESASQTVVGRRRGAAFGYNGYIYIVGGYDATAGVLADIEFAKVDVSTGDIGTFTVSAVTINNRWGLSVPVSNSYAYVVGGCTAGAAPTGCTSPTDTIQTFQVYNNNSGTPVAFTAGNTLGADRIGGSSTILNGYIYYAGGCSDLACTTPVTNTYYAAIDYNGVIGSWSAGGALPAAKTWGKLVNAGGTLYYLGGQTGSATTTAVSTIYYTSGISSGNPTWNGSGATKGIGDTGSGGQARTQFGAAVWNNRIYVTGGFNASAAAQTTVYGSASLSAGGNITSNWTSTNAFSIARGGHTTVAYANNLYILGGFDGTNYLTDTQFTQINGDGTVDSWTYSTSLTSAIRDADGFVANGYMYLVGGRSAATTCVPKSLVAPISANTTIASGNNPTGVGEWYETNTRYTGDRYGAATSYYKGRFYLIGGGCSAFVSAGDRMYYSTVRSQPQVAIYSRMIDTDTDVFPNSWLMNGIDNSIGARWQVKYRSMNDTDGVATDCGTADMSTWGQETNFGDTTLGQVEAYTPKDGSGTDIDCARYYYFSVSIDASQTFGYPEDVNRGPTIADLSLFFTADPSKRLRHGKTFTGGEKQPLDTPCRVSAGQPNCPLP
jgi:hypothetical protein